MAGRGLIFGVSEPFGYGPHAGGEALETNTFFTVKHLPKTTHYGTIGNQNSEQDGSTNGTENTHFWTIFHLVGVSINRSTNH